MRVLIGVLNNQKIEESTSQGKGHREVVQEAGADLEVQKNDRDPRDQVRTMVTNLRVKD